MYKASLEIEFEIIQTSLTKFVFATDYQPGVKYRIDFLPHAITSYYNVSNDSISASFEKNEANSYGNILLTIDVKEGESFILELLSGDKTIKSMQMTVDEIKTYNFNNLSSGKYSLKLIYDNNANGIWNTGDYYSQIKPERVEYYGELIDLKKGWDMDISWIIK